MELIYSDRLEKLLDKMFEDDEGNILFKNIDARNIDGDNRFNIFETALEMGAKAVSNNQNVYYCTLSDMGFYLLAKDEDEAINKVLSWE